MKFPSQTNYSCCSHPTKYSNTHGSVKIFLFLYITLYHKQYSFNFYIIVLCWESSEYPAKWIFENIINVKIIEVN